MYTGMKQNFCDKIVILMYNKRQICMKKQQTRGENGIF